MLCLLQVRALSVSLGYFIYDTVCCLLTEHDVANTAHHVCTVIAVAVGVLQGTVGLAIVGSARGSVLYNVLRYSGSDACMNFKPLIVNSD